MIWPDDVSFEGYSKRVSECKRAISMEPYAISKKGGKKNEP